MPPPNSPKVKIRIRDRFTDEQGGRLFGPGEWEVDPATSMRLISQGKATLVGGATVLGEALAAKQAPKGKTPPANPRIPPVKEPEAVTATPLPEDFPSRDVLVKAGLDSVESLRTTDVKEKLEAVEGLTPADITKIGLAISTV